MLEVKNISYKKGRKHIIKDVTYKFSEGRTYAILGNNGVGKSTLVKIIMGMSGYYKNHGGEIYLDGENITNKTLTERAKKGITITLQEPARFKGLSVKDYITLGGKYKINDDEIKDTLELVGLKRNYFKRKVDKTLSGGERKRIELASIIELKPKIVIFDEPDSGIDMMSNSMLKEVIDTLNDGNSTIISITHREEISLLADKALLLCDGKIRNEGDPEEINKIYEETCDKCNHINSPQRNGEVMK